MNGFSIAQSKVSLAYARGLFALLNSKEKSFKDKVYKDFLMFLDAMRDANTDTFKKINSPLIENKDRITIIKNIFDNKIDKLLIDFFVLLIEKGRFKNIEEIYQVCLFLKDEEDEIIRGEIKVAKLPDSSGQEAIVKSLSEITGKNIKASFVEDESVIAGFVTMMGTYYVDYSLSSHLKQIETELNRS